MKQQQLQRQLQVRELSPKQKFENLITTLTPFINQDLINDYRTKAVKLEGNNLLPYSGLNQSTVNLAQRQTTAYDKAISDLEKFLEKNPIPSRNADSIQKKYFEDAFISFATDGEKQISKEERDVIENFRKYYNSDIEKDNNPNTPDNLRNAPDEGLRQAINKITTYFEEHSVTKSNYEDAIKNLGIIPEARRNVSSGTIERVKKDKEAYEKKVETAKFNGLSTASIPAPQVQEGIANEMDILNLYNDMITKAFTDVFGGTEQPKEKPVTPKKTTTKPKNEADMLKGVEY
ncbi:MAG TPA: hypothetical protein DIV86_00380 [Alphaproteobacteria bacterium]|nr:hypothetical protein [Alphaproteobacteria bacterium]